MDHTNTAPIAAHLASYDHALRAVAGPAGITTGALRLLVVCYGATHEHTRGITTGVLYGLAYLEPAHVRRHLARLTRASLVRRVRATRADPALLYMTRKGVQLAEAYELAHGRAVRAFLREIGEKA